MYIVLRFFFQSFSNMLSSLVYLLLICLQLISSNDGARILGVFPMASPSHYILGGSLLRGLAEAGHDVTAVTPYPDKDPPKGGKWREVVVEEAYKKQIEMFENVNMFESENTPLKKATFIFTLIVNGMSEMVLNDTEVRKLINSEEKFDVVIVSQFMNDALKAIAKHFNAHLVLFSNSAANSWLNHFVGNPSLPSHVPEVLLSFPSQMTFFQRVANTLFKFVYVVAHHLFIYPKQNQLVQEYFPNVDLYESFDNISLVLLNSHSSIFDAQPLVPCMVEIGGFHVKPPKKLPKDLQIFLDDAKEGVIYFSMGSNLKSKDLPVETRDGILKAFSKRKEKILWKWEDDTLPGQPSNVKLSKWLPQQDILAHPNVKLFITHGGLLSTIETVYHGVPIIAIPIFGDQKSNAYSAQHAGYGLVLPLEELAEEKLSSTLDEILTNPKYQKNVKERSFLMKDRQINPLDNAVYWVEYIIRHNGAKHLRVPYLHLTWYQFYLLDVIGFILLVILATVIAVKKLLSYVCCRKTKKVKVKTN